jgi:Ca2+-transporting ATPase
MGHVLAIRSEQESFFKQRTNKRFRGRLADLCPSDGHYLCVFLNPIFKPNRSLAGELAVTILTFNCSISGVEIEKAVKSRKTQIKKVEPQIGLLLFCRRLHPSHHDHLHKLVHI